MSVEVDDVREQPSALVLWVVAFAGVAFWTAHVLIEVSLVPYSRHHHWVVWYMHALTVILAAATLAALLLSKRIADRANAAEGHDSPAGRTAFLGWFGIFANGANLMLIIVEGIYIGLLWTHA
jgi:hypothetical protein